MTQDNTAFDYRADENQPQKSIKQNRFFKSEARRTLFAADNFYKAVISHFISGTVSGGFLFMTIYTPGLVELFFADFISRQATVTMSTTVNIILMIIFSFLAVSFTFGAYYLASKMKNEPDSEPGAPDYASLSAMLLPLNSLKNARKTVFLYLILAAELTVSVMPAVYVFSNIAQTGVGLFTAFLIKTTVLSCSAFACIFFLMLFVPMPYIIDENKGASALTLYKKSVSAALCGIWRCFALLFSFIPLILLSVLTFGVLFFAYTLPYMTLSFAKVGEYLYYIENPERKKEDET